MNYEALGIRVREQRKAIKMTQEHLAAASGVSASFIGHIERGLKHCSLETLIAICNTLNVTPDYLLRDSLNEALLRQEQHLSNRSRLLLNDIANILREHDMD